MGGRIIACRFLPRVVVWLALAAAAFGGGDVARAQMLRAPGGAQVHAFIIGIDAYRNVRALKGAVADARDIEGSLRRMGVGDVVILIDAQASRAAVLREVDRLLQRTNPGDLVILSIAGHGTQEPERVRGSEPDGMQDVFLLPDFSTTPEGSQQRIIGQEFNHLIKQFEARGARVLFVADACHGGGLAREIDPRSAELSFRQVPQYRIPFDSLKPISTEADAFLSELDFEKSTFLAAVDRKTKSPEVKIPGIPGLRGALSYAVARAFEGGADADGDGKITLKELFTNTRQVVYQLSDQRQNIVTLNSPKRDIETDVVFELTRGVTVLDAPGAARPAAMPARPPVAVPTFAPAAVPPPEPGLPSASGSSVPGVGIVRIAARDGQAGRLTALARRDAPFIVVGVNETPDLVWDPASGDVLGGGDMIAQAVRLEDLPGVIDRAAAVLAIKRFVVRAPQSMRITPDAGLHHNESKVEIEVSNLSGRALMIFNIAGDGTVQSLYPVGSDAPTIDTPSHRLPVRVQRPFGADQVVAITTSRPMDALQQAIKQLNQRRTPMKMVKLIEQFAPSDARVGTVGLFTAP